MHKKVFVLTDVSPLAQHAAGPMMNGEINKVHLPRVYYRVCTYIRYVHTYVCKRARARKSGSQEAACTRLHQLCTHGLCIEPIWLQARTENNLATHVFSHFIIDWRDKLVHSKLQQQHHIGGINLATRLNRGSSFVPAFFPWSHRARCNYSGSAH